jgi:hypothetical protein
MNAYVEIINILAWPAVTILLVLRFSRTIDGLIPGAKVKFKFAGIYVETSLKEFMAVIQETYRHGELTKTQWAWLARLNKEGNIPYKHSEHYDDLRPLRNSGLIREHPEGWLAKCESVSITPLGELLLKNKDI